MESCPPQLYGGTERVVSYLAEELVRQGHDVTLFASGDLITSARLEACCGRALRLDANVTDPVPDHLIMLDKVRRMAEQFDILHFHVDILHYPLAVDFAARTLRHAWTTGHSRVAEGECSLSGIPFGFDLERPAAPDAASQMGGNRPSRPSTQSASIQPCSEGRIFRVSGTHLPGRAARPCYRNRRAQERD